MKIRLINFRKYIDQSFDLSNGITKISGESGTGKSTIFDGIYWCLYGKLQNIGRKDGSNVITGSTQVILNINVLSDTIQIERSGQKAVSLFINNELIDDSLAQNKINDIFGTSDKFTLTSYLKAESLHPLISSPPAERRELTSLLFPDAAKYDKLKSKLIEIRKKDDSILLKYKNTLLSSESSVATLEQSNPWVKDPLPENKDSEQEITSEIKKIKKDRDTAIGIIHQYETTKTQFSSLEDPIDISPLNIEKDSLKSKLTQMTVDTYTKENKIKYLNDELDSLILSMNSIKEELGYDSLDIQECDRLKLVCDELLSIGMSKEDIDKKINDMTETKNKLLDALPELERIHADMEYNEKISNILTCPCCNAKLRYTNSLEQVNEEIQPRVVAKVVTLSDIQKTKIDIDHYESKIQDLWKQSYKYNDLIKKETSIHVSSKDTKMKFFTTNTKLYKDKVKTYIKYISDEKTLRSKIDTVNNDKKEYVTQSEYKSIESRIASLSSEIRKASNIESQRNTLSSTISTLESKYKYLESTDTYIKSLDEQIDALNIRLSVFRKYKDKVRIYNIYTDSKNNVLKYKDLVSKMDKRMESSYILESILGSTYQQYVGSKLSELEYDISILGKIFFDETTNITLTPGKETSTGTIKPSFDIKVENNGIQYDDIKSMSTGEKKRLSIILLMVLSKYLDGKLILLDEAFTSFSMDVRGIVLSELKELGIPIYLTSHDDIPGGYDAEIDLNSLVSKKK